MKRVLNSCLFILVIGLAACSETQIVSPDETVTPIKTLALSTTATPTQPPAASPTVNPYLSYYKSCVAGNVAISSGSKKITPFANYVWSHEWGENGWINGDGWRYEYQSATQREAAEKQFPTLDYTDGVNTAITGNAWYSAHYVFYRDGLLRSEDHPLKNGGLKLELPQETGTCIVDLEITWLGQPLPNGKQNPAYITIEYLFKAKYAPSATSP